MRKQQISHVNMQNQVLKHFDDNASIWSGKMPLVKEVNVLRGINTKIKEASETQQKNNTKGYTSQKNDALDSILTRLLELALNVGHYAKEKNDLVLFEAVNFTETTIDDGSETEVENRCKQIAEKAKANITALIAAGYEVVLQEVDDLLADIETAKTLVTTRDVVSGVKVNSTASIPELLTEARKALKNLDGLVKSSRLNNDDFIGTYEALRFIGGNKAKEPVVKPPLV
ncbi:MAG: hypothetical protein ACOYMA_12475 [Bacteroidia bacterium]